MVIAILGGGISGLVSAFYLRELGVNTKIFIIEGSNRLGGWINSYKNENDSLFELGPRTLRVGGNAAANTLELTEKLGLSDKIIPIHSTHVSAKNRMIKVNGKLHMLPNSLKSALTTLPPFSKPLAFQVLREITTGSHCKNDESFHSFAQRKFGAEIANYAVDSMCRGIFAGNSRDLSVQAVSRRIFRLDQKYKSVVKGFIFDKEFKEVKDVSLNSNLIQRASEEKWAVWSLRGGLQTLVDALVSTLSEKNVEFRMNESVEQIIRESDTVSIHTNGSIHRADKAISCLPANQLKNAVRLSNPELCNVLSGINFVDVAVVNLEYSESFITNPGFGYLVPSCEPSMVLGVIYDSCVFPAENKTILTVMMGGYWFKELFGDDASSDEFLKAATEEIRSTFGVGCEPSDYKVSLLRNCIPQYSVGHFDRVEFAKRIVGDWPLFLSGNSYDGVGINDTIYNAKKTVFSLLQR